VNAPRAERAAIPAEYGVTRAKRFVDWSHVENRLNAERVYWLVAVRPDGRPHVRPVDGIYLDGVIYVGGSPKTRWVNLVTSNHRVSVHLDGPSEVLIWEGDAHQLTDVSDELAVGLAAASNAKYPEYGMTPDAYRRGVIAISPRKVICWTDITADPTRFQFGGSG
jgi:hypothetical protein